MSNKSIGNHMECNRAWFALCSIPIFLLPQTRNLFSRLYPLPSGWEVRFGQQIKGVNYPY